jgi:hypothetical protein
MAGDLDPVLLNVQGASQLVGSKINKVGNTNAADEGETGERIDALSIDLSDDELLKWRDDLEAQYAGYEASLKNRTNANKKYYAGKQLEGTGYATDFPIASNLQWEAAETFYPAALSKNPEPVVYADNTPEGNALADDVKNMLSYHADYLDFRALLTLQTRQWSIYFLGVKKWGWDKDINEVTCEVRRIQDFVFDVEGYVNPRAHFVGTLGERISVTADHLCELFPEHKQYITDLVEGKMGTMCTYTEWWTDEFCFVSFKDKILDKHKNEFFNYGDEGQDEFGLNVSTPGNNHFPKPRKPYTFLSVFTLGEQPHDITGLIEQNIPNQNLITKRTNQIDKNLSMQNNSAAFSENNFNQETATQAARAFEKGNPVLVPSGGPIAEAIVRFPAEGYPQAAFDELENNKQALKSSWGIEGIQAQAANEDQTARGMILNQQYANDRIGGGIGEAIERVAKADFNWLLQLYYVFYDEPHAAAVLGNLKATEYTVLRSQDLTKKLIVTVVSGSMKPEDSVSKMNQSLTLWQEGALDIKTLLTVLDFPDPQNTAAQVWLWRTNPGLYGQMNFPDLAQLIQQLQPGFFLQQPGQPQPGQPAQPGQPQATPGTPPSAAVPGTPGQGQPIAPPQAPPTTGGVPATASLSQVPLK